MVPVNKPDVNESAAPVTSEDAVAARPVKVAVPLIAATVVVPPIVQPTDGATVTLAVLVVALPY